MNRAAQISSLSALEELDVSLTTFRDAASESLAAIEMEIQRMLDWLASDALPFWKQQVRRRDDAVVNAKADLNRAKLAKVCGHEPECIDQKVALRRAQVAYAEAQEKVAAVKRWLAALEPEIAEYRGVAEELRTLLDINLAKGRATLSKFMDSIESYLAIAPPSGLPSLVRPGGSATP